ncbi:tryptophan-rich sensory protein [Staphylococcus ureilyticus]
MKKIIKNIAKYFFVLFIIFKVAESSIKNNESYYENLKRPKYTVNSLLLPILWLIVNMISNMILFLYTKHTKKLFLSHNLQLFSQCYWYIHFFKRQQLQTAFIIKLFQALFMLLSIKSIVNKKRLVKCYFLRTYVGFFMNCI